MFLQARTDQTWEVYKNVKMFYLKWDDVMLDQGVPWRLLDESAHTCIYNHALSAFDCVLFWYLPYSDSQSCISDFDCALFSC
jgi:hypothetical protein